MQFLTKVIAIYSSKKIEFNSINNNKSNELAYFQLADVQLYFYFELLDYIHLKNQD